MTKDELLQAYHAWVWQLYGFIEEEMKRREPEIYKNWHDWLWKLEQYYQSSMQKEQES